MAYHQLLTLMAVFYIISLTYGRTASKQSTFEGFNEYQRNLLININNKNRPRQLIPNADRDVKILEQYDRRYANGTYEYKFVLSNGVTRYEKSYWVHTDYKQILIVKGYFSQHFSNGKYLARFYTADANGFHDDYTIWTDTEPVLPNKLADPGNVVTVTTTRRSPTSRPTKQPALPTRPSRQPITSPTTTTTRRSRRTTTIQNNEQEYNDQDDYR